MALPTVPISILARALRIQASQRILDYTGKNILQSLHYHGIIELGYKQFSNKPKLHSILQRLAKESIAVEMARAVEIDQFVQQLHRHNLDFIVFKGTALAYFLYRNAWQRPRSDTDILVNREDIDEIIRCFTELGYQQSTSISGQFVSYQTTVTKQVNSQFIHRVDIHWKINNRQILAQCYNLDELLEHSMNCSVLNQEIAIPNQVDSLILACIHRLGHHADKERLIWIYDIHLLAESLSREQWALLIVKSRQKNVSKIVFDGISTSNVLLDTKIDPAIYHALKKSLKTDEQSAIFLDRDIGGLTLFWQDMVAMPAWRDRLILLKEHLIPNREFLAAQYPSLSFSRAVIKRFVEGLAKKIKRNK